MTNEDHKGTADAGTVTPADVARKAAETQPGSTDLGFPEDTPVSEMSVEQQAAYWKHKARKHEKRSKDREDYDALKAERDQLKAAQMTDAERAVEDARKEGESTAAEKFSAKIAEASLRGALAGRGLDAETAESKLSYVDFGKFLNDNGEVDSDKVQRYIDDIAPQRQSGQWIDMGQGRRDDTGDKRPGGSVEAGRDIRRKRQEKREANLNRSGV